MKRILFLLLIASVSLTGCELDPLPRDNGYDIHADHIPNYTLAVSRWEILYESITTNGILDIGESMYVRAYVKNNGPEPAPDVTVTFAKSITENTWISFNSPYIQNLDSIPSATVRGTLPPGQEGWNDLGSVSQAQSYSFMVRAAGGPNPLTSVTITATISDRFEQVFTSSTTYQIQ